MSTYKFQGAYRLLLAFMVLWSHSLAYFFPEGNHVFGFLQLGNAAVSIFFVVSGYLMYSAILNYYQNNIIKFIVNRYLRISPPLLLAAVASILVHAIVLLALPNHAQSIEVLPHSDIVSKGNIIAAMTCSLYPFDSQINKLFGVKCNYYFVRYSWAIITELNFYWILAIYTYIKRTNKAKILDEVTFLLISLASIVGILVYNHNRFNFSNEFITSIQGISLIFDMQWMAHFFVGITIAKLSSMSTGEQTTKTKFLGLIYLLIAVAQLYFYCTRYGHSGLFIVGEYLALLFVLLKITHLNKERISIWKFTITKQIDRKVGDPTYYVYINHYYLAILFLSFFSWAGLDITHQDMTRRACYFLLYNLFILFISTLLSAMYNSALASIRNKVRGSALD